MVVSIEQKEWMRILCMYVRCFAYTCSLSMRCVCFGLLSRLVIINSLCVCLCESCVNTYTHSLCLHPCTRILKFLFCYDSLTHNSLRAKYYGFRAQFKLNNIGIRSDWSGSVSKPYRLSNLYTIYSFERNWTILNSFYNSEFAQNNKLFFFFSGFEEIKFVAIKKDYWRILNRWSVESIK